MKLQKTVPFGDSVNEPEAVQHSKTLIGVSALLSNEENSSRRGNRRALATAHDKKTIEFASLLGSKEAQEHLKTDKLNMGNIVNKIVNRQPELVSPASKAKAGAAATGVRGLRNAAKMIGQAHHVKAGVMAHIAPHSSETRVQDKLFRRHTYRIAREILEDSFSVHDVGCAHSIQDVFQAVAGATRSVLLMKRVSDVYMSCLVDRRVRIDLSKIMSEHLENPCEVNWTGCVTKLRDLLARLEEYRLQFFGCADINIVATTIEVIINDIDNQRACQFDSQKILKALRDQERKKPRNEAQIAKLMNAAKEAVAASQRRMDNIERSFKFLGVYNGRLAEAPVTGDGAMMDFELTAEELQMMSEVPPDVLDDIRHALEMNGPNNQAVQDESKADLLALGACPDKAKKIVAALRRELVVGRVLKVMDSQGMKSKALTDLEAYVDQRDPELSAKEDLVREQNERSWNEFMRSFSIARPMYEEAAKYEEAHPTFFAEVTEEATEAEEAREVCGEGVAAVDGSIEDEFSYQVIKLPSWAERSSKARGSMMNQSHHHHHHQNRASMFKHRLSRVGHLALEHIQERQRGSVAQRCIYDQMATVDLQSIPDVQRVIAFGNQELPDAVTQPRLRSQHMETISKLLDSFHTLNANAKAGGLASEQHVSLADAVPNGLSKDSVSTAMRSHLVKQARSQMRSLRMSAGGTTVIEEEDEDAEEEKNEAAEEEEEEDDSSSGSEIEEGEFTEKADKGSRRFGMRKSRVTDGFGLLREVFRNNATASRESRIVPASAWMEPSVETITSTSTTNRYGYKTVRAGEEVLLKCSAGFPTSRLLTGPPIGGRGWTVVVEVPNGERANIVASCGDFLQVTWSGVTGWADSKNTCRASSDLSTSSFSSRSALGGDRNVKPFASLPQLGDKLGELDSPSPRNRPLTSTPAQISIEMSSILESSKEREAAQADDSYGTQDRSIVASRLNWIRNSSRNSTTPTPATLYSPRRKPCHVFRRDNTSAVENVMCERARRGDLYGTVVLDPHDVDQRRLERRVQSSTQRQFTQRKQPDSSPHARATPVVAWQREGQAALAQRRPMAQQRPFTAP